MDSKLPKPSGLKRPVPLIRSIVPMERIKMGFAGRGGATLNATISTTTSSNLTLMAMRRAHSPDLTNALPNQTTQPRAKLRRSRSACDIREMRTTKRVEQTLAPIPAKVSRLMSSLQSKENANRPPRLAGGQILANRATAATATAGVRKAVPSAVLRTAAAPSSRVNAIKSTTTVASKTKPAVAKGAAKPTAASAAVAKNLKRIPSYDFKARFLDLQERHKTLKDKYDSQSEQLGSMENLPEQLEELQAQVFRMQEQLRMTTAENEQLREQSKMQILRIESLSNCLATTKDELFQLKDMHQEIKAAHEKLTSETEKMRDENEALTVGNGQLTEELRVCREQVFRSNVERKELHNAIMDLRGNIRVFCRIRPPLSQEADRELCQWNYIDEVSLEMTSLDPNTKPKPGPHQFEFDQVFHPHSIQTDIFALVSPLIQSALDGYNVCIFAYGQTGSGKTYTMDGVPSNPGIVPRTVELLFNAVKEYRALGWEYEIRASFLEIYNEVLYDLLSNEHKDMDIRMVKGTTTDVYVTNITEEMVTTPARLQQLMEIAKSNRATASTAGNERSSRSHAVTKLALLGRHAIKNEVSKGHINLVDLAGSESPKTSLRMAETKNINRSLSDLTNVILALTQRLEHVPFRNSKLTRLLMPALGGNSKTLMFINASPFQDCFQESLKSLRFASMVNSCRLTTKRNRGLNHTHNQNSFDNLNQANSSTKPKAPSPRKPIKTPISQLRTIFKKRVFKSSPSNAKGKKP